MPKGKNKDIENLKESVAKLTEESALSILKSQLDSLRNEITDLKSSLRSSGGKQLKYEMGEFDIREVDGRLDDEYDWEGTDDPFDFRYYIPITLNKFSKAPKIFLSITAFYKVDGIWIYPENITSKGFDITIESNEDLDTIANVLGGTRELVISWLALGY